MKKTLTVLIIHLSLSSIIFSQNSKNIYFNEVRANDQGADNLEYIELIAPAGTDLTGLIIVHYNGRNNRDGVCGHIQLEHLPFQTIVAQLVT